MIVIIVVKINVPHILSIVFIFKVILAPASDCNNYIHNQPSPYYISMVVILQVILDLAGDCNNYSCNQRSPCFEYGSSSCTQRSHTYE